MEKFIFLVNTQTHPCPGTHYYTSAKFCNGFMEFGYKFIEIKDDANLENIPDLDTNLFLVSDHGLRASGNNPEVLKLFERFKNSVFLMWFYQDLYINNNNSLPYINKYLLTSSHFRKKPLDLPGDSDLLTCNQCYMIQQTEEKYIPLSFSSYFKLNEIGISPRNEIFDTHFVGYGYKIDWTEKLQNSFIRNSNLCQHITEEERIVSFLQSYSSLGLHSIQNIQANCIVERVFEGMALGCCVLTDNPVAEEETDGIVKYIDSYDSMMYNIEFIKNNHEYRKITQERGYKYIKTKGSYVHVADKFLQKVKQIYG